MKNNKCGKRSFKHNVNTINALEWENNNSMYKLLQKNLVVLRPNVFLKSFEVRLWKVYKKISERRSTTAMTK